MDKKNFWKGFATGAIAFILAGTFIYLKFFVPPDISLDQVEVQELNGEKFKLANYKGKPLVVNYWATWCAPCLAEFPSFDEVKQQLGNEVDFLMISDEALEKINKFSASHPYTFKYLKSDKLLPELKINTRPATYFYNSSGTLITKHIGGLDAELLKELIEKIK